MENTPEQGTEPAAPVAQTLPRIKWIIVGAIVIVGLLAAGTLFSPEHVAERAIEQASEGEYDVDLGTDGSMTVTGKGGETMDLTVGERATLPDGWPSSIPILPGAEIESSLVVANDEDGGTNYMVTYLIPQDMASIAAFYREQLSANGWTIEASIVVEESTMLSAQNENDESVVVNINVAEVTTTVVISYQSVE